MFTSYSITNLLYGRLYLGGFLWHLPSHSVLHVLHVGVNGVHGEPKLPPIAADVSPSSGHSRRWGRYSAGAAGAG